MPSKERMEVHLSHQVLSWWCGFQQIACPEPQVPLALLISSSHYASGPLIPPRPSLTQCPYPWTEGFPWLIWICYFRSNRPWPLAYRIICTVLRKRHVFLVWVVGPPWPAPTSQARRPNISTALPMLQSPGFPCFQPSVLCPNNIKALGKLERQEDFIQEDCNKGERLDPLPWNKGQEGF